MRLAERRAADRPAPADPSAPRSGSSAASSNGSSARLRSPSPWLGRGSRPSRPRHRCTAVPTGTGTPRVTTGRRPDGTTERNHVQRRTKAELREVVRELEGSQGFGDYVWTSDDFTLDSGLEHWLANVIPMTARWKTLSNYRSQMRLHVVPARPSRRSRADVVVSWQNLKSTQARVSRHLPRAWRSPRRPR